MLALRCLSSKIRFFRPLGWALGDPHRLPAAISVRGKQRSSKYEGLRSVSDQVCPTAKTIFSNLYIASGNSGSSQHLAGNFSSQGDSGGTQGFKSPHLFQGPLRHREGAERGLAGIDRRD